VICAVTLTVVGAGPTLSVAAAGNASQPPTSEAQQSKGDAKAVAEIELARAEAAHLRQQIESERSAEKTGRVLLPILGPLVGVIATVVVAFLAIVLPIKSQRKKDREERKETAEKEIAQRKQAAEQDVAQRERELVQRFDASFATAVGSLANSRDEAIQIGGAAALQAFARPDLEQFHEQVYLVVRAHLDTRIQHKEPVRAVLVATIERLLRFSHPSPTVSSAPRTASGGLPPGENLSCLWLQRANLRKLDLAGADLYRSDLRAAHLDGSSLRRARGWKVDLSGASLRECDLEEARFRLAKAPRAVFTDARLVSARFEEANLDEARFRGAKLQSAHFEGASLRGTDFRDASVSDAYFWGADLDLDALESMLLAADLVKKEEATAVRRFTAHLDQVDIDTLRYLAQRRGWDWAAVLA
jgi:uncharacterized protein YjbI with pentapeptide repeats